jgi:putative transposase
VVHWYRNIFSRVPTTKVREAATMLKAIHAAEDVDAARQKAAAVIEKLKGMKLTKAADLVADAFEETSTYYRFPEEHLLRICTNNPLERLMREIRRRARVLGAFPDGNSCLNLAAATLRHIAGTARSLKRDLTMNPPSQRTEQALTA